jgi:hypothetical protein
MRLVKKINSCLCTDAAALSSGSGMAGLSQALNHFYSSGHY